MSGDVDPNVFCTVDKNVSPRCGPHGRNQTYATKARTVPVATVNLAQSPKLYYFVYGVWFIMMYGILWCMLYGVWCIMLCLG